MNRPHRAVVVYAAAVAGLQSFEVRGPRALLGLLYLELDLLALLQVRAADVFHVEEDVLVGLVSLDESVTAGVVEEVNLALRNCR